MRTRLLAAVGLTTFLAAPGAWAKATFKIEVTDDPGVGFNDTKPATPVGGNTGTTVGEQRLKVFQAAADAWGRILDSAVPIVVDASFAPLECMDGMAVAGQAAPLGVSNVTGLPTTNSYPIALANKLVGRDLSSTNPDIVAQFNGAMAECIDVDWYYGLDGNAGSREANLLTTVIHELGHGLGFTAGINPETGATSASKPLIFTNFMLDASTGKHFNEMTNAERKAAMAKVRKLVWDGKRTDAVTARFLAKGTPTLQLSPSPSGFSGAIGEANFGSLLADVDPITADIALGTMNATCTTVTGSFSGKTALIIAPDNCASLTAANQVQKGGGLALLFAYSQVGNPPPVALEFRNADVARFNVTIPTVALTKDDANAIKNASGAKATLSADKNWLVGADTAGHALLFATDPAQQGSTGAHWDPVVRPNLTMEPAETINPVMYLDMERAVLWDIGWTGTCGNGTIDGDEACDEGEANSDYFPDKCRLDCTKAKCGDGVVDSGEQCDPGGVGKYSDPDCDASCRSKSGGTGGSGGNSGSTGKGGTTGTGGVTGVGGSASSGGGNSTKGGSSSGVGGSSPTSSGGNGGSSDKGGASTSDSSSSKGGSGGSSSADSDSSSEGGNSGDSSSAGSTARSGKSSGCSCRTGGGALDPGAALTTLGLALLLATRLRRSSENKSKHRG